MEAILTQSKDKPWIVAFRSDWHRLTPEFSKVALTHSTEFHFWVAENWADLPISLALKPKLLLIHHDTVAKDVSLPEFIAMVRTLCKIAGDGCNTAIGITIDDSCTPEFIKELRRMDIAGVVPAIYSYGVNASMQAISMMLSGKQSWPKDILDGLMQVKKPVKIISPHIHLTVRQQQVMDLVCHRGLPNKTIANMLKITESTVKIHVSAILKEYGVRNRTQLALAARDALHA